MRFGLSTARFIPQCHQQKTTELKERLAISRKRLNDLEFPAFLHYYSSTFDMQPRMGILVMRISPHFVKPSKVSRMLSLQRRQDISHPQKAGETHKKLIV
jgi:hypothetical protein